MTAHPERERDVAGDQAAERKPLGEPLEHRPHDESERLQVLDAVFKLDSFDEKLGAAARHERRVAATARKADQLDAATAQPRADRVGIKARQLAQPAHPPSGERGLQVVAAIRFSQLEHVERQPVQEFALAAGCASSLLAATPTAGSIPTLRTHRVRSAAISSSPS